MTASDPTEPSHAPDTGRRSRIWLGVGLVTAIAVVLVVVVAAGGSVSAPPVQLDAAGQRPDDTAPTFAMASLESDDVIIDLADRSGTPIVLNFWASWCIPCRREMRAFETVHREYSGRVAFIGINHQDSRDDALDLVAETGVTYPSVHDPQGVIAFDYDVLGLPTTVFIDADGRIAGHHTGELTEADLRAAVEEILAGEP